MTPAHDNSRVRIPHPYHNSWLLGMLGRADFYIIPFHNKNVSDYTGRLSSSSFLVSTFYVSAGCHLQLVQLGIVSSWCSGAAEEADE